MDKFAKRFYMKKKFEKLTRGRGNLIEFYAETRLPLGRELEVERLR
jgi:hypothetical protein